MCRDVGPYYVITDRDVLRLIGTEAHVHHHAHAVRARNAADGAQADAARNPRVALGARVVARVAVVDAERVLAVGAAAHQVDDDRYVFALLREDRSAVDRAADHRRDHLAIARNDGATTTTATARAAPVRRPHLHRAVSREERALVAAAERLTAAGNRVDGRRATRPAAASVAGR